MARLFRKTRGTEERWDLGRVPPENRNGLVVDVPLTQATGKAEHEATLEMVSPQAGVEALDACLGNRGYDTRRFIAAAA